MSATTSRMACSVCGGVSSALLRRGVRHDPEREVRQCLGCDLAFVDPMPSPEELAKYYAESYRDDYGDPPAGERYRADVDEARERVRRLVPILKPDWRVLEIGAGSGAFLKAIEPYVGEVVGIEPDIGARAWTAMHLNLALKERLEEAAQKRGFDMVLMFHVLEHLPDPVGYVRELREILKPSGRLVFEVPNLDDALVTVYRVPAYVEFYFQKAHLFYYTKKTLAGMLSRAGLWAEIQGVQRYDLSNHIRWMLTGMPGGQRFYGGILGPAVGAAYAEALIKSGNSDTLWAVASAESAPYF